MMRQDRFTQQAQEVLAEGEKEENDMVTKHLAENDPYVATTLR